MAKTKISEWSATPASNTDIDGINIAEGCAPSGINDAIREMMAQVKDLYSGTTGDAIAIAGGGTGATTASAARTALGVAIGTDVLPVNSPSYGGTLTGGTGVVNLGSGQFYKDASGNVGIGTSSPGQRLQVNGPTVTQILYNTNAVANDDAAASIKTTNGPLWNYLSFDASSYRFNTCGSERMRIDSSGNLLVGTTSAQGNGVTISPTNDIYQKQSGYSTWKITGYNGNYYFNYGGSDKGTISGSTGAYTALSDATKKTNIKDSAKGLDVVMNLRPVSYEMIDSAGVQELGFIAQEVQPLLPEAYVEQAGSNGLFIGLTDRPIIAVLVKAIQEQQAIITALTARVEALEAK